MTKRILILALTVLLAGCAAGLDETFKYDMLPSHSITVNGDGWKINDDPARERMMIQPDFGRSMGAGILGGLTGIDTDVPKGDYQIAVVEYLRQSGRQCAVTDGYKLANQQWEFTYSC